jgi:UV DNA damage repair endonuclease
MLDQIKDRKSESWIHHERLELCEDRALPIWLKHHRNELMNETVANGEFDLTKLFEEGRTFPK